MMEGIKIKRELILLQFFCPVDRIVNGTTFVGLAEEKERALQDFERRQQSGENVGLVESRYVQTGPCFGIL